MKRFSILLTAAQMRFQLWVVAAFFLSILLPGCASLASRGLLPDVKARRSPEVNLGSELVLLEEQAESGTSIIDKEGRAHVFVTNAKKQLYHIELVDDKILTRELLGVIETDKGLTLDAVEHPSGKLRVLAGNKQFSRSTQEGQWEEIKGNRCIRFIPAGDDLFCAFVIKGEEVAAPKRTDVTFGWFVLVPVVFWSNKQASKLVIAHESADGWTIHAVLDPDTHEDADSDFLVGTDSLGTLHLLYGTSRGGGFFYVLAGPGGAAGDFQGPSPGLRYAQVALDRLLAPSLDSHNQGLSPGIAKTPWVPIQGTFISSMPTPYAKVTKGIWESDSPRVCLRPFNRHFVVNKMSGEVRGLTGLVGRGRLDDGVRKLDFGAWDNAWVEVGIRNGDWTPGFNVVAAKDLPDSTYDWSLGHDDLIKNDSKGNCYALLETIKPGFFKATYSMTYLVKDGDNWSAALPLGRSRGGWRGSRTLAVDDSSSGFAAWVNKEGKFVGRWIRPRGIGLP